MSSPAIVRRRFAALFICCAAVVGGCSDDVTPPLTGPMEASASPALETPTASGTPTATLGTPAATCGDMFTAPPYDDLAPVPGLSVRSIDKAHFEIINTSDRQYYFAVFYWVTEDDLVCGRGVIARDSVAGPIGPGSTFVVDGGSTPQSPVTVSIWGDPCGDGCTRTPIGEYLIPISSVEPPPPETL